MLLCSCFWQTPRPSSGVGSATPGFANRMYPSDQTYSQYGSTPRFGANGLNSRSSIGQWGLMAGKYKPLGRGGGLYSYGNETLYGELNRGPRGNLKSLQTTGLASVAVKGENLASIGKDDLSGLVLNKEQYNRENFPEEYSDAKFFIIKSYSEDDIHKSIKYSVWASTPNGNKKLDAAFRESQVKAGGCPIFLFFSVSRRVTGSTYLQLFSHSM